MNRWSGLAEKKRKAILSNPNGWMIRNILQYGNTLIDSKAFKKCEKEDIIAALQYALAKAGFRIKLEIEEYNVKEHKETDYVARIIQ
nr:hypothetical protein [uncultured Lachnoclostridium sp.]